ncbi:hypothetical protein Mth01_14020 [Sphaerimonospora thailandensis]|uniref:DNA-binding SARP family transcriptional activator n=1 Tax=Sphaerimonospora thailandensis TaxID=795644 RepID=A0A8J3R707_9ACTN|nr:hypothetical protein Mth01_14020 [Sphaerimonospora thailandensis]
METDGDEQPISKAPLRGLFAVLLLNAGRTVSAIDLLENLWENPGRSAPANLRNYVARLRAELVAIDPVLAKRLVTLRAGVGSSGGYYYDADPGEVDVHRFQQLTVAGGALLAKRDYGQAESILLQALSLWRGPAGQDCTAAPQLRERLAGMAEHYMTAQSQLISARLALGHDRVLIPEIQQHLARDAFREDIWCQLICATYLGGSTKDSLDLVGQARRLIIDELGVEPSDALGRLQHAILERRDDVIRFWCNSAEPHVRH